MVEFRIRIHPKYQCAYIPKELAQMLGTEACAIPARRGVFLYPKGANLKEVLRSLEVIRLDLEAEVIR